MKRSSFLKSLAALFVAPKLVGEINWGRRLPVNSNLCVEFPKEYLDIKYIGELNENGEIVNKKDISFDTDKIWDFCLQHYRQTNRL